MNPLFVLLTAFAIGLLAGLRAFTPIALVSWLAVWGWLPLVGSPFWFVGTTPCAIILSIFAVGELITDKLPRIPARTQPAPLAGRIMSGAISAVAICRAGGQPWFLGALCGAVGSIAGAFGGYHLRRFVAQRLGLRDVIFALAEDLVAIVGTLLLLKYFFAPIA
jgi:uncharacterized membrane protein